MTNTLNSIRIMLKAASLSLLIAASSAIGAPDPIARSGWSFDRSQFREPAEKVAEVKQANREIKLTGWAEYDVSIPNPGWYELVFGGIPADWSRDVLVDGKTVSRLGWSDESDRVVPAVKDGVQFKEVNLFLTSGKHCLRIQRLGFPGELPRIWELRAAEGRPGGSIHTVVKGSRIIALGAAIEIEITGGMSSPSRYELLLRNEITGSLTPTGGVAFPSTAAPIAKEVSIPLKEEGLYTLQARVNGEMLHSSDLKTGYFLAAEKPNATKASGAFQFAGLFRDGAVLQREKPLPVWGWAEPGAEVTVTLAAQTAKAVANQTGRWQVVFAPLPAGGPHELKAVSPGGKTIVCKDVLVGEVWLLSGQSNMGGPLLKSIGGEAAAKEADFKNVRLAFLTRSDLDGPERRLGAATWTPAVSGGDPGRMKSWIAIHYAFGTELYKQLGVPIGLLAGNRGGTYISSWTSLEVQRSEPAFRAVLDSYVSDKAGHVKELVILSQVAGQVTKWKKECEKARKEGKPEPARPAIAADLSERNAPGLHYDELIAPAAPYAIRGFLWYQGESDSATAEAYRRRFPALIQNWRDLWSDPKMPFLYVQIAFGTGKPFEGNPGDPAASAELREAQLLTLAVPHTAMIAAYDLPRPDDNVHYLDKLPVGHRLALAALGTVYGKNVETSGPMFRKMELNGAKARLFFDHIGGGLVAKGGTLKGFAIAGGDRKWVWAEAEIEGDCVLVRSAAVSNPVAVRYSWANGPVGANLFNKAGLPAPTFRTDNWPLSTAGVGWVQER